MFEKVFEELVESTKLDLLYDVWAEKIILEGLSEFRTPIWFSHNTNHSYHF